MPTVPSLLTKLQALHRQHVELEHEIAAVERAIVQANQPQARPRRNRSTHAQLAEMVRTMVKLLREAGEPLPRREIASRLGLTPSAVNYRLQKAIKMRFVESIGRGRYRTTNVVPVL